MSLPLLTVEIRLEPDVVSARQRARQIAGLLGYPPLDQTRIATAVSEIARNAFQYAGGGTVEFRVETGASPGMLIRVRERGPGIRDLQAILDGRYDSPTGLGVGILGAKRLMDRFEIESTDRGAAVTMIKDSPRGRAPWGQAEMARVSAELARNAPLGLQEELLIQNQELLRTLQELRERQAELAELHARELEETNRGVVALYSELDENAKDLRRISELKSRFLSNMSHEFRSPLNTILSMSGFLLDGSSGRLTAEQETEVGFIRKAAESLTALVNDLLDLAKVEAGKAVVRVETFDVADLFETLRGTTRPLLAPGVVLLIVDEAAGLPPLRTDEGKVAQILRNFLSNAAKFTERGEIRLGAKVGPGGTVVFTVSDTGIGIAPADQRRVFEEFNQVDGPVQKRVKGTGLGLPLSRKLAELLGGGVSVRSDPGAGSTFFAVIPRSYKEPDEGDVKHEDTWRTAPPRRPVLVVEDDPVDLLLYENHLRGSGFQVLPARSLDEARRVLDRVRPVAVLLDVVLDAGSGWSLLAEMKGSEANREVPIFVVSVLDGRERAMGLGAADFHLKPIGRDWLLGRLEALGAARPLDTILIIDDEEADRYALKGLLNAQGRFAIVEAPSGEEGLRRARAERPDAIFLDLFMPDMTGFEVLERLKSDEGTRDIPVVLNTSGVLDDRDLGRLAPKTAMILSKSAGTAEEASATIREALANAGLNLDPAGPEG
ncbi:ATP-binding protein [Paludisphaera soli]|uniref:ATP-binding protein n=1 Tax=Paludisphaera soli TaxID=2712865 RepID=UPI0013EB9128|nr:ATP-binding protein [Paludisphaera soli]